MRVLLRQNFLPGEIFHLFFLPLALMDEIFYPPNFLFHVNDYIEPMVILTQTSQKNITNASPRYRHMYMYIYICNMFKA